MKEINNNVEETYCSFEVAKLLTDKGFNTNIKSNKFFIRTEQHTIDLGYEECDFPAIPTRLMDRIPYEKYHVLEAICPTHQIAIKWIRLNYNIHIDVSAYNTDKFKLYWTFGILFLEEFTNKDYNGICSFQSPDAWNSHEEAIEEALLYVLTFLI